ncbi:MAG: asparagine synthase (glutamine-hydrolyzing) [Proteobacteria bacterium]|nr:asparagine synthase (glutamine-hydrolyzing) [Pseudomonadota bacterium]
MCGIWISVGYVPNRAHLDVIDHRGPDGDGWQEFDTPKGPLALGHRRLAIIDTGDSGHQPMSYADNRYWITYNGEIYNYLELREELRARGCTFRTQSDTEVVLAAYATFGRECLSKLRGMFAFAIYDTKTGTLFLARDRFGIKPLYFVQTPRGFAAGSEIKQLLLLDDVSSRINPRRAYDFLVGGLLNHSSETLFDDVTQLGAGEWLELDRTGKLTNCRWYRLPALGSIQLRKNEASDRFLHLLQETVRLHLRADVEVGSCLSGGLDSSTLVMLMAEQLQAVGRGGNLNTVTARFEGTAVDETPYADEVAKAAHARMHAARPVPADVLDEAKTIVWHQDEPYGSTSIHAQWHVFAAARAQGLKVMLDGQGADEILAGYHGAYDTRYAELVRNWRLLAALILARRRSQWFGNPMGRQLAAGASQLAGQSPAVLRRPLTLAAGLIGRGQGSHPSAEEPWLNLNAFGLTQPLNVWNQAMEDAGLPAVSGLGTLCNSLIQAGNVRMLLHWEDRNSMAHGVEARVPFLDHPLVEFCIAIGSEHKLVNGWTKWILRDAMKGRLPEAVRLRKDKLGFATPEAAWLRGPLLKPIEDAIERTMHLFPEHFSASNTRMLVADMLQGRRPLDFTPWRIACFGIWADRFGARF